MTTEISTPLLIDGQERETSASFPVYDPAHAGEVIGHAASLPAALMSGNAVIVKPPPTPRRCRRSAPSSTSCRSSRREC